MIPLRTCAWFVSVLCATCVCVGSMHATDIGGTISTTLTITTDSQLVDDVTCTVTNAPCIAIAAPDVKLELNGFTMTGQADARVACTTSAPNFSEIGIDIEGLTGVVVQGPGLVQQFRGPGVFVFQSTGVTVTGITLSTNCFSGILVGGGSAHEISSNVSVRNGNPVAPCGGI
jgi:hypothetical protein